MARTTAARAAVLRETGAPFSVEPVEIEGPRGTEILVRIVGSGVCHTDIAARNGIFGLPTPCVLGHEGSGVVEAVGPDVTKLAPGDHVVLTFRACGTCPACGDAQPAYCYNMFPYNYATGRLSDGSSPISRDGERINACFLNQSSFATHAIAEEANAVKVRDDVPLEILAPLGCGIQTGAGAAINALKLGAGDTLVVFGGGAVGLSAMLGALAMGASMVIIVEPKESRRALALELGAAHALDPAATADIPAEVRALAGGVGASHAIDTTGNATVIATAADTLRNRGTLGLVGVPPLTDTLAIGTIGIIAKGLTIRGIVEGDAQPHSFIPELIELYRQGRFPFDRLIKRYQLDRINDAVDASLGGEAIKPLLVFDD